jgi:hypothetical protein
MNFRCSAVIAVIAVISLSFGCAHGINKLAVPTGANPNDEFLKFESDFEHARGQHADLLAPDDYQSARRSLLKAQKGLKSGAESKKTLDEISYGKAYLLRAQDTSEERRPRIENILRARSSAIEPGSEIIQSLMRN